MLTEISEFKRHLRQSGLRMALYHARRHLLWEVIQRFPRQVLYHAFEVYRCLRPGRSDANPLRLVWVKPDAVVYLHDADPRGFGEVARGDWDTDRQRFEDSVVYQSIVARFQKDVAWQETNLFRDYQRKLEDGDPYWRCTTNKELHTYFKGIDQLYDNIQEDGYKSQRELHSKRPARTHELNNDTMHPFLNEIGVNIYRDGSFAKNQSGTHRLAIAKVLEVDVVPVVIRARHAEWQAIRNEIRAAAVLNELSQEVIEQVGHPDLTDIVPDNWVKERKLGD